MKILGIDLGSFSIKVAELEASSKGFVISNFFEFPLSLDANRDRDIQIIEALRSLAANYDPLSTRWVIGVPQHRMSALYKRFPFHERPKIQRSLAFELEDEIPLDIDETIFDFKIAEFVGASADVLAVACPKEVVRETLSISKDCGFDPEIVAAEGLALANIFESWNAMPPNVAETLRTPAVDESGAMLPLPISRSRLILHLGHTRSILLVYRDASLVSTRSLQWGGKDIANALSETFGFSVFEANKVTATKSFILMNSAGATPEQLKLSQTIAAQVDWLIKDLRLTLLEIKTSFHIEYTEIELMGGTCQIQNLGAYMTQGLEIPVNVNLQSLSRFQTRLTLTPQIEASAPIAVGLAIEGMKRPRNPAINFRKDDFVRENVTLRRFWETWRVPVQVAMSAFAAFMVFSIVRDQFATTLTATADEKLVEAAQKAAGIKGAAGAIETKIRSFIKLQKTIIKNQQELSQLDSYISAMDILARISEKMPGRTAQGSPLDLTLFEIDNDDLTIRGKAQSPSTVQQIERSLKDIAVAKSLTALSSEPGTFGFKLKVKRKE